MRVTRNFHVTVLSRAGHAPPLPRNHCYCPVGRGDPTPPGSIKFYRNFPPLVVGASIARPWRLPVRLHYRCGCNGRHICRPYRPARNFRVASSKSPYQKCAACAAHRVSQLINPKLTPAGLRLPKVLGCPQSSGSARRLWRSARHAGQSTRRFPGRRPGRC